MICIKSFVVHFIMILEEDIPRHCNKHTFHKLFPAFSYDIVDRIPDLLRFVYKLFLSTFFFKSGQCVEII